MARINGLESYIRKLRACAPKALERMRQADDKLVDQGVARLKAIAPVDPGSPNPGAYRDSVRKENKREGSVSLVAGAPGFPAVGHLEYGHKTPDGGHVRAEPSFHPVVRELRKKRKGRLRTAIKAALKEATQ